MDNETKKSVVVNLRVTPEYKKHVQDFASFFGSSVSEMMYFGMTLSATYFYNDLIKYLEEMEADMKKGSQKKQLHAGIEKLKEDRQYFVDAHRDLPKKPDARATLAVDIMQPA